MPKIRIYLEKEIMKDEKILLDFNHSHYLKNVMRKESGDFIYAFNDLVEWKCKINFVQNDFIVPFEFIRHKKKIEDIWICFSLIKKSGVKNLIQKASEIGVVNIIPMITEHSEKLSLPNEKLKKISIEATEQCDSLNVPKISETQALENLLDKWEKDRLIFFCDETGGENILNFKSKLNDYKKFAIFIGPIGGWSQNDKNNITKKNIVKINLGQNILKADTAAIYTLSCLKALMQ